MSSSEELVAKKKTFSPVWNYFGFKMDHQSMRLPQFVVFATQRFQQKGNTSNLFSHLQHRHSQQYAELKDRNKTQGKSSSQPGTSQPTVKQSLEASQPYARGSKRWQELTDSVSYVIAKDFASVEKPGFKRMIGTFDRRYVPPSRKYFSKTAIPRLYSEIREKVQNELKQVKNFSATTDLWSSQTLHPYMSYTVHFINEAWEMKSLCLQTSFLPLDHTGANLADALEATLDSWGLKSINQVCITTDNASNIISATNQLNWQRVSCFGHNLNLAVTKSLKNDHRIVRALGLARKIVSAFSNSWKRRRELQSCQVAKDLPQHNLIHDCPTRWGAMESMVTRLLEQEEAVRVVLSSDRKISHLIPTWQDIQVLESISKALSPLSELTDFLSGETHVTVSSVIPVLYNLKTTILSPIEDDTSLTKDIKKSVLDDLNARYTDENLLCLLSTATFLDTRFKTEYFDSEQKDTLRKSIEGQAKEILTNNSDNTVSSGPSQPSTSSQPADGAPPPPKKAKLSTFLKKCQPEQPSLSPTEKISKEVDAYLSCPMLDVESEVTTLQWWKEHGNMYPVLAKLAAKFLCVCATSCPSERIFSTSGHIVTPLRASLNPHKVNMLVFLAKNL